MAALTGEPSGLAPGSLRVRTTAASARPGDEPLTIGPQTPGTGKSRPPVIVVARRQGATSGPRLVEVVVDGWRFELEVEPAARAALRERASRDRGTKAGRLGAELRAIIPGRIVAVSVAPGDPVSAGQQLLVVEAMKMQNEVRTPLAGIVERLAVSEGQTIELGDLLVVIGEGR